MRGYLDLVGASARVHRRKNRLTLACVSISVFLVAAIFGMADMEIRAQRISRIRTDGNWHAAYRDIDAATAERIGLRADVARSGWVLSVSGRAGYSLRGRPFCACGISGDMSTIYGCEIVEGAYPRAEGETALTASAKTVLGVAVGDTVAVAGPDGRTLALTVTGFINDVAILLKEDAYGALLTPEGLRRDFPATEYSSLYAVQFSRGARIRKALDDIARTHSLGAGTILENTPLLGLEGQSRDNYMIQLYLTAAGLFVLVLVAGILMIASSFNANVADRVRFFGMLRCLGASRAQIRRYVLAEGLAYCVRGIPAGLAAGTVIVWALSAFLRFMAPGYFADMPRFGVSLPGLIAGALTGGLTVTLASLAPAKKASRASPLEAIAGGAARAGGDRFRTAAKTRHRGVDIALGIHHATADRKGLALLTASFAISIALYASFSVVLDFMHEAIKPLRPWSPDVSIAQRDGGSPIDESISLTVAAMKGVRRAYPRMFAYDVPATVGGKETTVMLISYERYQLAWARKYLIEGKSSLGDDGEPRALAAFAPDCPVSAGDAVSLRLPSGVVSVGVEGILSSIPFNRDDGTQILVLTEAAFRRLTGKAEYAALDVQLGDDADESTVASIRALAGPDRAFSDRRMNNAEIRAGYFAFAVFLYGFVAVIASISVISIVNGMNMSISGRINRYGAMRAVGMSGRQLARMVATEAAAYALSGCAAGVTIAIPIHRAIYRAMITSHWGIEWAAPVGLLSVTVAVTILATGLSIIGPVRRIRSMDIVAAIGAP